jgi:hypothetical protein
MTHREVNGIEDVVSIGKLGVLWFCIHIGGKQGKRAR